MFQTMYICAFRSSSGSTEKSPGQSPHHGTHRKLPAPPEHVGNGLHHTGKSPRSSSALDEDDYDHLNADKRKSSRRSNYDHVVLGDDGRVTVEPRKEEEYAQVENIYTPVKDNNNVGNNFDDYSEVADKTGSLGAAPVKLFPGLEDPYATLGGDEKDISNGSVAIAKDPTTKDDPYSRVKDKDDPYARVKDKFDPYSKVKDPYNRLKEIDDPYNRLREPFDDNSATGSFDDFDPYNKVKDVDPYNKVKDDDPYNKVLDQVDPYNKLKEVDPYNKIKGDELEDPYNKIKGEDPYNSVLDDFVDIMDDPKDDYATVASNRKEKTGAEVTTITVTRSNKTEQFVVESGSDEYAVVMKNKQESSTSDEKDTPVVKSDRDSMALPPEPPRNYRGELVNNTSPRNSMAGPPVSPRNSTAGPPVSPRTPGTSPRSSAIEPLTQSVTPDTNTQVSSASASVSQVPPHQSALPQTMSVSANQNASVQPAVSAEVSTNSVGGKLYFLPLIVCFQR